MTPVLERDAAAIKQALMEPGDHVSVNLSRETAELVAKVVDAEAHGRGIVFSRAADQVSPAEAAGMLGVSRPYVRKLMERGELPFEMVGTHHRIPTAAVERFRDEQRSHRHTAVRKLLELENELGLTE
ncbi:MAG: excisionase family DNA-binding protein [Bifidobacteriaceae bacterium]|jgi:excisionase family DNA binding protein|nr:excisionase family DNA-binding protein [Bifidobacteriaceae bacterium]